MIGLQGMVIGGLAIGAVAFVAGHKIGGDGEARKTQAKIEKIEAKSVKLINDQIAIVNVRESERDQCRAEVAKYNAAEAVKTAEAEAARLADQIKRDEAIARTEAAQTQAAKQLRDLNTQVAKTLEVLRNAADECARAPVSADTRSMLNGILAAPKAGVVDRSMPSR